MKPIKYKYLYRALSLVGISMMSLLLVGTTGASAHDQSQFNNVTNSQNQTNDDNNDNDNGNDDNNNNNSGGGGYIPGGNTGGGGVNNGSGGISTGGATAGATANNGSATVVSNPQGQSVNGTNNSTAEGMTGVNDSAGSATTKTGSAVTGRSSNQTQFQSNNSNKNNGASASVTSQKQPQNKETRNSHSDHYSQKSMHSNGQFQPSNKTKQKPYKTTWRKGQKLDRNQRREVRYERKHWKKYNKYYPNFNPYARGGDCTNWASQDRAHAGARMTSVSKHAKGAHFYSQNKWTKNTRKWYCRRTKSTKIFGKVIEKHWNYSTSWSTVNGFYKYWTKTKHRPHFVTSSLRKVMSKVRVGDVIQLHSKKYGWHHTITVSKVTKHMGYYTSHTRSRLFAPLTKIKKIFGLSRTNRMRVIEMGI